MFVGKAGLHIRTRNSPLQSCLSIFSTNKFSFKMTTAAALALASFLVGARAQQAGTLTTETHPSLSVSQCTASGCTSSAQSIVLDANWRWLHDVEGYTNCYTGNTWNATLCPDGATCATNCALDGGDYQGTYGITASGDSLKLGFVTTGANTNVGSRSYLMAAGSETEYQMLQLLGQEFTFDVDVSNLPCGLNGALYFSEMDADGGMSKYPTNKAGAKYGTGYCDSQCPQDIKFINGEVRTTRLSNIKRSFLTFIGQLCWLECLIHRPQCWYRHVWLLL
jgi:cellulose 1,4-beta-cellobiosidase